MRRPMAIIHLELRDGRALISPAGYLRDKFESYLQATRSGGAGFDKARKCQSCMLEHVPQVVSSLKAAGFATSIDDDLNREIRKLAQEAQGHISQAEIRIETVDAELQKRGLSLYPFQRTGVCWLATRKKFLLADEMGLGKTIQALTAIPEGVPVVVVCPAALKGSPKSSSGWYGECKKWRPDLHPVVCSGRGSFRWPRPGELILINYDILPEDAEVIPAPPIGDLFGHNSLPGPVPGTIIISDEVHNLKNKKTLRFKRFHKMADAALKVEGRVGGLTGTPLLNKPPELWNILEILDLAKECFTHYGRFYHLFGGYSTGWGTEWGAPKPEVAVLLKMVMLARKREEVLPDLPVKTWQTRQVDINKDTRKLCDDVLSASQEAGVNIEDAIDEARNGRNAGISFENISRVRAALATAKIPELVELVKTFEESQEPVVVFSDHRAPVDTLAEREGWASITGDTPNAQRNEVVDLFQTGKLKGLAITIKAGGIGITLTQAHQAIFVDMNWTPALNAQAEDRLCRIGQTRGVVITRLVADHELDERMTEILARKQALISATVDKATTVGHAETIVDKVEKMDSVPVRMIDMPPAPLPSTNGKPHEPAPPTAPEPYNKTKRQAMTNLESWAETGLVKVASMDPDRARDQNGIGFSKMDNDFGHSLADTILRGRGLSDKQWVAVVRLARKYRRQIGAPPED